VKKVLQKDASVLASKNLMDDGWSALHYAAKEGDIEVVKLLLQTYHADPTVSSASQ
jgi:ankyrin repeat protein